MPGCCRWRRKLSFSISNGRRQNSSFFTNKRKVEQDLKVVPFRASIFTVLLYWMERSQNASEKVS
ncbi:hypothetical protein CS542_10400 [Pedobacter sp. IW39]|nr:hypothetical protein CS542_10400 [Pedobacter sp. IW39]